MRSQLYPWQLLSVIVAGIFNDQQQRVIDYLKGENRVFVQHRLYESADNQLEVTRSYSDSVSESQCRIEPHKG